jgi:hypothetical protein
MRHERNIVNKLLATAAIVIALASSAHSTEILDTISPVSVVDPSNGEKFQLGPQDAATLMRICGDNHDYFVNCIHRALMTLLVTRCFSLLTP